MIDTPENNGVDSGDIECVQGAVAELPASKELRSVVTPVVTAQNAGVFEQDDELTPNDVATPINVSRPHVMKLIRSGLLVAHHNGAHSKVKYSGLVDYITRRDSADRDVTGSVERVRRRASFTLTDEEQALLDDM